MSKEITIGCDPEWGLIKNGGIVSASGAIRSAGEFGVDGCGRVAELRPPYGSTAKQLVENTMKVLRTGYDSHPHLHDHIWKAGSMVCDEPIGGHIHLGHAKIKNMNPMATRLSGALDKTLAVLCLMVEDGEEALNRRYGSSYGAIGGNSSFRDAPWGLEYRVLGSWLTSPEEALAILSLCHLIAKEFENEDLMNEANSLPAFDTLSYKECDKMGLLYYLPPIIKYIKKLPEYSLHEEEIIPLFKLIRDRKIWSCKENMIDTWKLNVATKKKVTTEAMYSV